MRCILLASALVLAACGGPEPLKADVPTAEEAAPKPTATPPDVAALPTPETRVAAMNMVCGGDTFRVAFEDQRAVVVNDDGSLTPITADAPARPGQTIVFDQALSFRDGRSFDRFEVVANSRSHRTVLFRSMDPGGLYRIRNVKKLTYRLIDPG